MKIILILVIVLISTSPYAKTTQEKMSDAFNSFIKLQKYALNEKSFTDEQNHQVIYTELFNLSNIFKDIHNEGDLPTFNYSVNAQLISSHFNDTLGAFEMKQKYFARNRVKATTSLCISCHSQIKTSASLGVIKKIKNLESGLSNDLQKAELFFVVRDYKSAQTNYLSYMRKSIDDLKSMKKLGSSSYSRNIVKAFRRIVSINTRTFFKPEKALNALSKFDFSQLSTMDRNEVALTLKELAQWKEKKYPDEKVKMKDFLGELVTDSYTSQNKVHRLVASGYLKKKLLNSTDKSETAEILLYLSKIENSLSFNYFYSLSDAYLMSCMDNFSKFNIAKKCYEEYEKSIIHGYSGSSGTSIPKDIQKRLKVYKEKIFKR